jgi:hypothetical protein
MNKVDKPSQAQLPPSTRPVAVNSCRPKVR